MERAYLLLGSNEGDRRVYLGSARDRLESMAGKCFALSSVYETAAWGKAGQPPFLNQVMGVETRLSPAELLKTVLSIESGLGRLRTERWARRTLDIDILFYGDQVIETPDLIIPHAAIPERRFTLVPMAEVAPAFVHPVFKKTMEQLLADCSDALEVRKFKMNS